MSEVLDDAIARIQVLNDELRAEGRGIFDAARNTDLAVVTENLLTIAKALRDELKAHADRLGW